MKRALLFSAAIVGAIMVPPAPSYALIPVIDEALLPIAQNQLITELKSLLQEVKSYAQDAQTLAMITTQAESMIAHPSLGQAQALLGRVGIGDPFSGIPVGSMYGLVSGYSSGGGLNGIMSRINGLGALVNGLGTTNSVYTCTDDQSFACQQQLQRGRSNAGFAGIILKTYADMTGHIQVVNQLRTDLQASTDPSQREAIQASLQAETVWTNTALGQMAAARNVWDTQRAMDAQRDDERLTQDGEILRADLLKGG